METNTAPSVLPGTRRADKTRSTRYIFPKEYLRHAANRSALKKTVQAILDSGDAIGDILFSMGYRLLDSHELLMRKTIREFLAGVPYKIIPRWRDYILPENEFDVLGLLYQAVRLEGDRNQNGAYYTPENIIESLLEEIDFAENETVLDPCCGSGAFLMCAKVRHPDLLFGYDIDPIAVMLAKINLWIRFAEIEFSPQIFCCNFLEQNAASSASFHHVISNPPWGAQTGAKKEGREIFGQFLLKGLDVLAPNGSLCFLLPESVLNVIAHAPVRKTLLKSCALQKIKFFDARFSGVFSGFLGIHVRKGKAREAVCVQKAEDTRSYSLEPTLCDSHYRFRFWQDHVSERVKKINKARKYDLSQSIWALGIVTGNNDKFLRSVPHPDCEVIFSGREVQPYRLSAPERFIHFAPEAFQQSAAESIYRSPEKLVYRFIAERPVFAYDNQRSLILNSANCLIPNIPNMSIKTVMAFLNSALFADYFRVHFETCKILKSQLCELPFPHLSLAEDRRITRLVDRVLQGDDGAQAEIEAAVNAAFGL